MSANPRFPQIVAVLTLIAVLFSSLLSARAVGSSADPKKTNVLFIVSDDLRCSLGCYGDDQVKSPSIDRLAARGVRFERAYCQYPVCNPSRTSFLTGKRPDTTGILDNGTVFRARLLDVVTLPQLFRQNGYFTAGLGKIFHLGLDASGKPAPFQDAKSWIDCRNFEATPTGQRGEGRSLTGGQVAWCRWLAADGSDEDQPDGQIAAEAVRLIETDRKEPFFLGVGFHKPHDPFHAPRKYFDLYPLDQIRLARDPADHTPDVPLAIPRGQNLVAFSRFTDRERREFQRAYQAGISFTDAQVGKLLGALDRKRLWDSTIVVFMGDHGYHLGEHGWWNKVTVFELCARTPLIVWAPGARGMGESTAGIVEFIDLYPTIAELCGLQPPRGLEGTSFRPLLDDPLRPGKRAAYTQVVRGPGMGRSVRTDRWRYTEWVDGKQGVELYDHSLDPLEYHNLAHDPQYAATRAELKTLLHAQAP
jgi:arylsulfatase A-like enzyme